MKFLTRLVSIVVLLGLMLGISSAQNPQEQSIEAFLMEYINMLNTGDYANAYRAMDNRNDSYEDFVAGYEHTVRIVPYFGFAGAAAGSTYITTILLGFQDDGRIETYYGYFQLHSGQLYEPIRNNGGWVLGSARFQVIAERHTLQNATMQALLSAEWQENPIIDSTELLIGGEMNSDLGLSVLAYYDLINEGDYATAYNSWRSHLYLPSYDHFVLGYEYTEYVMVYVGASKSIGSSSYLVGYLPTFLVAQETDGSYESYIGCYAIGHFRSGALGLVNGSFSLLSYDAPTSNEIFDALADLDCATLNMGL